MRRLMQKLTRLWRFSSFLTDSSMSFAARQNENHSTQPDAPCRRTRKSPRPTGEVIFQYQTFNCPPLLPSRLRRDASLPSQREAFEWSAPEGLPCVRGAGTRSVTEGLFSRQRREISIRAAMHTTTIHYSHIPLPARAIDDHPYGVGRELIRNSRRAEGSPPYERRSMVRSAGRCTRKGHAASVRRQSRQRLRYSHQSLRYYSLFPHRCCQRRWLCLGGRFFPCPDGGILPELAEKVL